MYHAMVVVSCRVQIVGVGNTWAVCQILARNRPGYVAVD